MRTDEYREDSLDFTTTTDPTRTAGKPSKLACVLAGLLVGAVAGAGNGGVFTLRTGDLTGISIGAIVGPLLGLIAGSRIASFGSVFEGAAMGGFLFGYDSSVINGAVTGIQKHFNVGSNQTGFAVASALLGSAPTVFSAPTCSCRRARASATIACWAPR